MRLPSPEELLVDTLGEATLPSPLALSTTRGDEIADYVPDDSRVLLTNEGRGGAFDTSRSFEKAGPRERIFFDPATTRAAIVTCGGLCPGLNNVIRGLVLQLHFKYGVKSILGYRYGYSGLAATPRHPPLALGPDQVRTIHRDGGSLLGTARGAVPAREMVDTLVRDGIQVLFALGGDGTLRGAEAIYREVEHRGLRIAVVGVPKTIDNDIPFVERTFGFDTAVEMARLVLGGAHAEAVSAENGIGLVKVMGRDAGFIAATATLASVDVNYCLIPEIAFDLEGERGLLASLEGRLAARGHALLVIAEGCAQRFAKSAELARDASGNVAYATSDLDAGLHLKGAITRHFKARGLPVTIKYIDPSYLIRSVPANAYDSVFCDVLARNAVHCAMAGKTGVVLGRWGNVFTHLPLAVATAHRKRVDPDSALWLAVTEATGQPDLSHTTREERIAAWNAANRG